MEGTNRPGTNRPNTDIAVATNSSNGFDDSMDNRPPTLRYRHEYTELIDKKIINRIYDPPIYANQETIDQVWSFQEMT